MNFASAYDLREAPDILYRLLEERPPETWISHQAMPTREAHQKFIWSKPYVWWFLIEAGGEYIGDLCVTDLNEIGIHIFRRFQRKGYATRALDWFIETHEPLMGIPAKRCGYWLANVALGNEASKSFFRKAGFAPGQDTYAKR